MLSEMPIEPAAGRSRRRWFSDSDLDLIVWFDSRDEITGFQLCYDRSGVERAVTWTRTQGYFHNRIDDGEGDPTKNQTPILVTDGTLDRERVAHLFDENSEHVPATVRRFILGKLQNYPLV